MRDFEYEAPQSVEEAVALLSKNPGHARPLAGGTDLLDQVRTGRLTPDTVVDLKRIPALNVLEVSNKGLRLGAAVPCYKVYGHPDIARDYSALADATRIIGGTQIQSRASVGGNLCNSGPAADSTPALIALGATAVIAGPKGLREVPVEQFCTGPGKNVLTNGEFLVELKLPPRAAKSGSHYQRFIPRNEMDIAVVGVGVSVTLDAAGEKFESVRIGLGAIAATPLFAHAAGDLCIGQPATLETFEKAAAAARSIAKPIDDMRGTVEFRLHVTGVLVRRSLEEAVNRARG